MSSKRKTPKKKSKEEDVLFQAVHEMVNKKKTPLDKKSKTPRRKTPKQKGGQKDFLNKIENLLFSMNKIEFDGIGIDTTFIPLNGNTQNINRMFTEVKTNEVNTDTAHVNSNKNSNKKGGNSSFRVVQTIEEDDNTDTKNKGGYGKKFINNHVRLYEGLQEKQHFSHPI